MPSDIRTLFCERLLTWHAENARDLPWCGEKDPYKIWVSEIMLQQTTTQTVKGYYQRFLAAFPTVNALAGADDEAVLKLWEGLGYYSRARNLIKAARIVVQDMNGVMPHEAAELKRLPGIGDYTAAAIASMAFDRCEAAMDGNLTRVLARITCEEGFIDETAVKRRLHDAGMALIDEKRPGDFNQAMMGLGNLICVPASPRCEGCPVSEYCLAHQRGCAAELPRKLPRPDKKIERRGVALVFFNNKRVLLRRRPDDALLGGLWEFPHFENALDIPSLTECLEEMGIQPRRGQRLISARHVFTHKIWAMTGFAFSSDTLPHDDNLRAVDSSELDALPMPTAMKAFRTLAAEHLEN